MAPSLVETMYEPVQAYTKTLRAESPLKNEEPVYTPGRTSVDVHEDYEHKDLLPRFPNLRWDPLVEVPYVEKGLLGHPEFKNLLGEATDVFDYNPKIGTEIHGVSLATLTDAQKNDLARLISIRGVVFFRDQKDFSIDDQRKLGEYFGTLHKHATTSMPRRAGLEDVHVVYTDEKSKEQRAYFTPTFLWHSDVSNFLVCSREKGLILVKVTYEIQPPSYTSLKVLTGPPRGGGGDTLWSSQYAAYDTMSTPMQKYLEQLTALHSSELQAEGSRALGRPIRREPIITEHPIVRTHPVTGWKSLFFNPGFVKAIVGIPKTESDAIIRYLNEVISTTQEFHVRFQWNKNDVAYWDNRVCLYSPSMWPDKEPSILEYARFHDLTVNYRESNPLSILSEALPAPLRIDESGLVEITKDLRTIASERLEFGKGAVIYLASIINASSYLPRAYNDLLPKNHRIRDLKLEPPLLQSDHELDMQQFGARVVPDLKKEHLPLERVNDERDEGLGWPSSYAELPAKVSARSLVEKLSISKDVLLYLRDTLQWQQVGQEQPRYDSEIKQYRRNTNRDPITPPLLPMSPEMLPFVPSSDVGCLDLLSEHSSPFREELYDLDKLILKGDNITPNLELMSTLELEDTAFNSDNIGDLYSPLKGIKDPPSPPILRRRKAADLKVDGPLTPPRSEIPPPWKSKNVSLSEALLQIIPDFPSPVPNPEDTSSEDIDRFFAEVVRPIAEQADRRIEQEQLQEADTTRRVKVPIMDFARPIAPWKQFLSKNQDKLIQDIKHDHLTNCFWPLSGKAERALPWSPFPANLAKVAIKEFIDEAPSLAEMVAIPESIDPMTLIWKIDGIRIFDDEESDTEDIALGHFSETVDMKSLIRKRKMDLQEEMGKSSNSFPSNADIDSTLEGGSDKDDFLGGTFSALSALDHFTSIRTGEVKRQKLDKSSYFPSKFNTTVPEPHSTIKVSTTIPVHNSRTYSDEAPIPLPKLTILSSPRSFIISSILLLNRPLFRLIQTLYPTAEFIERDFTLHNPLTSSATSSRRLPQSPTSTIPLIHEADILLSPSTGLLLTTLPQITQRPLPGSIGLSPIYNRILHTAPRYELLIILVSDASPTSAETPTSLPPLLSLHAFCASIPLPTPPYILFVPASPPSKPASTRDALLPLATYIVHLMTTHSLPTSTLSLAPSTPPFSYLQQDETTWELFLRRAGLNAFAAQAVLAALRPPTLSREWVELSAGGTSSASGTGLVNGTSRMNGASRASGSGRASESRGWTVRDQHGEESTLWGLAAFVRMGAEERARRFEGLLGGRGLLERVGRVVDGRWA
ncbi:hypothetical protein MMC11_003057 [Xylographa trunciseda]|nr:hypothetical protein [Xylographa trunciseda]